jgi:hypothetical protein
VRGLDDKTVGKKARKHGVFRGLQDLNILAAPFLSAEILVGVNISTARVWVDRMVENGQVELTLWLKCRFVLTVDAF